MDLKLPTEIVSLPSKGILYPKESLLSKGEVEMKYMTAREEDILVNAGYIKNGTVIDRLLQSLLITPIDLNELLLGDKNALIIAARILGYGKNYDFNYRNGDDVKTETIDLSELADKEIDISTMVTPLKNEFGFTLPISNIPVTFKILTHGDDKDIEQEIKGLKKLNVEGSYEVSTRLKYIITSVNGKNDKASVRAFVDNYLRVQDIKALRDEYARVSPDVIMKFTPKDKDYTGEGIDFQIGVDFFWPDARI
jgi:hypothetical protein